MKQFPHFLHKEFNLFKKLDSPSKIQNFLDKFAINFETDGRDTCRSPLKTLAHKKAHCIEGAMLAAAIFWYHRQKPLLLDLKTTNDDLDHVVALFKQGNRWGAVSKTNHAVLRYRDPIYKSVREIAMSYFNEYFLDSGKKTLRSYSAPFSLLSYPADWLTSRKNLWKIPADLDQSPHFNIMEKSAIKSLRPADPIEIKAGKLVQWN